jgi:hypothetical protein
MHGKVNAHVAPKNESHPSRFNSPRRPASPAPSSKSSRHRGSHPSPFSRNSTFDFVACAMPAERMHATDLPSAAGFTRANGTSNRIASPSVRASRSKKPAPRWPAPSPASPALGHPKKQQELPPRENGDDCGHSRTGRLSSPRSLFSIRHDPTRWHDPENPAPHTAIADSSRARRIILNWVGVGNAH